jgi:Spy/CpxP family protein refolding chaperone
MNASLKGKLVVGFLLVFVAGAMTGSFVGASHARHLFLGRPHQRILAERMRSQLRSQLNLTSEQMDRASAIFDKTAGQLEAIRTDTARRVHETVAEVHRQLASDLTPEQRAKLKEIDRRHQHMYEGGDFRRDPAGRHPPP